jgi:hypothetical protein
MSAANFQADLYQLRQSGDAAILNPGASGTFDLRGRDLATVTVTATGTYTLPNAPKGTVLLIICDDTSTVTVADAGGTIGSFVGTTLGSAARCTSLGTNSWSFEVVGDALSEAASIGILDSGAYTAATNVESALQAAMQEAFAIRVPMTSFVDADGDPLVKWSAAPTPGHALGNSEAFGMKWGANATHSVALTSVALPRSVTLGTVLTMNIVASKIGATVGDATTFTVTAFVNALGALHDASTDLGGVSSAMQGDATSKTVQHETLALTMPSITAPAVLTFTIQPTNGTLGTDLVIVHGIYFTYAN